MVADRQPPVPQLSVALPTVAGHETGAVVARRVVEVAQVLDDAGVDRLVAPDHVAFGGHLEAYGRPELGGIEGGRQPTGPDGVWLDPLMTLAAVSAVTTRVRLGTVVLQAALRRPVVLAKAAATLDVLSNGRLDLGVGVGWQREEYDAAGLDFDERGPLLDHTLRLCRAYWTLDQVDGIHQMPKPVQPGGVPLWISGSVHRRTLARIAAFGDGWIPWGPAQANLAEALPQVHRAVEAAGRRPELLRVMSRLRAVTGADGCLDVAATLGPVTEQVRLGVTDFRLRFAIPEDDRRTARTTRQLVECFRERTNP